MFLHNRAGTANHTSLGKYHVLKSKPPQTGNTGNRLVFFTVYLKCLQRMKPYGTYVVAELSLFRLGQ